MTKVVDVVYDGEVFRPTEPVNIAPNSRLVVYVSEKDDTMVQPHDGGLKSFFERYKGTIPGPEDWSEEHDHYIHGALKRSDSP